MSGDGRDPQTLAEETLRLAENATPGPWRRSDAHPEEIWADRDPAGWDAFLIATLSTRLNPDQYRPEDAEFIAHARTAAPALARWGLDEHAARVAAEAEVEKAREESDYRKAAADVLRARHEGGDGAFWAAWHRDHCAAVQAADDFKDRAERSDAAIDRARMERAQAEDAETAATERAESAERENARLRAQVEAVRALADDFDTVVGFRGAATAIRRALADVSTASAAGPDRADDHPDESREVCRDCGAPWRPVRRGECSRCGSDAGPIKSREGGQ